jgi:hypothetical protein
MINEYERKQYLRERAQRLAQADLDAHTITGNVAPLLFAAVGQVYYDPATDSLVQRAHGDTDA